MAFAKELTDLRQELRLSTAGTISFWPKLAGTGNVVASATAGHNTWQVYDPSGVSIEGPTNCTVTSVSSVSRLDCAVAAIATLGEDYRIDVTWRQTGSSVVNVDVVYFDVVRFMFGRPSVSLNDLQEERPDAGEICTRLGTVLGLSSADTEYAAVLAYRARVELDAMIRSQVAEDATRYGVSYPGASVGSRHTRPNLILNRERLNRVETMLALRALYAADMSEPEGADESAALYRHYAAEVQRVWASVGPLKYDSTEDLVSDSTKDDVGRSVRMRRVQG